MKVVLLAINATWAHTNLAVRCLRDRLEQDGHTVRLLEYTLHDRVSHILEALWSEKAELYGFSCYLWNIEMMLSLGEELKKLRPEAHLVLGGPEVSYATERFDALRWIDVLICGEGEEALATLCRDYEAERAPSQRVLFGVPCAMEGEGVHYRLQECGGGTLYYESSRGCPFFCSYCLSSATRGVRMRSVEQTLSDLLTLERKGKDVRVIKLVDRTFNADPARANAIWKGLLSEEYTKCYQFEINAALLNEESFSLLSAFPRGRIQLEIGLQSTHPKTLESVARHIDPEAVLSAVRRLRRMGNVHLHLDLIAGLPYESYERFARSFDDAYGIADQLQLGFLKLLYGTPLAEKREEYGYLALSKPPYTVLQSRWISYPEMQRLHAIEEVLDRVAGSGRFVHTLWYLEAHIDSPFAFWEGLADHLVQADPRPVQKRSQPEIYRALLDYSSTLAGIDAEQVRQMLATDFSENENKRPPAFLRSSQT